MPLIPSLILLKEAGVRIGVGSDAEVVALAEATMLLV